jgi:hypothetical protein
MRYSVRRELENEEKITDLATEERCVRWIQIPGQTVSFGNTLPSTGAPQLLVKSLSRNAEHARCFGLVALAAFQCLPHCTLLEMLQGL